MRHVSLFVLLLAACPAPSSTPDAGATPDAGGHAPDAGTAEADARRAVETFCRQIHTRICDAWESCGCRYDVRGVTREDCVERRAAPCIESLTARVVPDLASGKAVLGPERLAACDLALADLAADCSRAPENEYPFACNFAIIAAADLGADCDLGGPGNALCAGGNGMCLRVGNAARCEPLPGDGEDCPLGLCAGGMRCDVSTCRTPGDAGAPCSSEVGCRTGLVCGVDDTCREPLPAGATCERDAQCVAGAECEDGSCVVAAALGDLCARDTCGHARSCGRAPETRTCETPRAATESCDSTRPCAGGLRCNDAGTCEALPTAGQDCVDHRCADGFGCEDGTSKCVALPGEGAPCLVGSRFCAEGLGCDLDSMTCERGGTDGAQCLPNPPDDHLCADGFGCHFGSAGSICRPLGEAGATCETSRSCAPAYYCRIDTCEARVAEGEPCPVMSECGEGLECWVAGDDRRCRAIPGRGEPCVERCRDDLACTGAGGRCVPSICTIL